MLSASQFVRVRDQLEEVLILATGRAMRRYLTKIRGEVLGLPVPMLTAAATPPMPVTLSQFVDWWREVVGEEMSPALRDEISTVLRITGAGPEIIAAYMESVQDRLVHGLTPPVYEDSFDLIRRVIADASAEGWSIDQLSQRIASELSWETRGEYWRRERARIDRKIDSILDPLGPPGSPGREAARLNDPRVQALRDQRNRVIKKLDAERSYWQTRAERIARTESAGAVSHAQLRALESEGVEFKEWLSVSDARTRPDHSEAHGQIRRLAEPFVVGPDLLQYPGDPSGSPEEIINCVIGSTQITWPGQEIRAVTRREYVGEFFKIITARGHDLTVTPNHPILTPAGYVPAKALRLGQEVVCTDLPPPPEVENGPPSIEEVYRAASEASVPARVIGSGVDFHGDGSESEIEVVGTDGGLLIKGDSSTGGKITQEEFTLPLNRVGDLSPLGAFEGSPVRYGRDLSRSSPRLIAGSGQGLSLFEGHSLHSDSIGFGSRTAGKAEIIEAGRDHGSGDSEVVGHLEHAMTFGMSPSKIVKIEVNPGHRFVYNLHTSEEWYSGNGIGQHNCRCVLVGVESPPS